MKLKINILESKNINVENLPYIPNSILKGLIRYQ